LLVALSDYALPEDLLRVSQAGFAHHMAKPASLEKLKEILAAPPVPSVPEVPEKEN
jgi:CheY-like chemotaxis protein